MHLLWWLCVTVAIKKLIGIFTVLRCSFPPNLENLHSGRCEWNSHIYYVFISLWWWCIYSSSPKSIVILTVPTCIFPPNLEILPWRCGDLWRGQPQNGANLVIPAWMGEELLCGQAHDYRTNTHGQTHRRRQMTIPGGQNWPRLKITQRNNVDGWTLLTMLSRLWLVR